MNKDTVFLVAFFKFQENPEYGFKRLDLQHIFKSEYDARNDISFCDEAGWYEGVLIEERALGRRNWCFRGKRVWMLQNEKGELDEFQEPEWYNHVINIIG